jgi:hypothetical protein
LGDAGNLKNGQRLDVVDNVGVGTADQDVPLLVGQNDPHFLDPWVVAASGAVGSLEETDLGGQVEVCQWFSYRI